MKKSIFFAAAVLLAVGCQKSELLDTTQEQKMITHTFSVDDEATKSLYDPSDGYVKLDKTESIAVGYTNADISKYVVSNPNATTKEKFPVIAGIVEAKRNENSYTFSHNAIDGATGYNYYFLMPYRSTSNISTNGTKTSWYAKIDAVQHPTATSFDPLQDYILGEAVLNVEEQQSAITSKNLKLKRLFALVRVTLRDSKEEFGGEPLMSVSMGFPLTENSDKKNNLVSLAYLRSIAPDTGELLNFANAGLNGYADVTTPHVSPTVTAEYSNGLAMEEGTYTVWYVTMPVEKAAGTELTVVAQSKNKKVTRKIALPKAMKLKAGIINDLKINITGEGYDVEDTADPNDYWSIYNAGQDITVGGQVINKAKNPGGVLLEGDTATKDNLQKGGLIFLGSNVDLSDHLKLGGTDYKNPKETILIGRKKDVQPKISLEGVAKSIYFENGKTIIKNIDITSGTAGQLFVTTKSIAADIDYAIIEDCNITASKHVYVFNVATPVNVVKSISFDNCVINLTGTDSNYTICRMGASNDETITASGYAKFESVSINNCIIYATTVHTDGKKRRMLVDYGSNTNSVNDKRVRSNYLFPTKNLNITVTNNTIVNINANGNILVRANVANSANINKNVIYTDLTPANGNYKVTYLFGLYNELEGTHDYKIRDNYSYVKREASATGDALKWKYTSAGPHTKYNVGGNTDVYNAEELPITIGTTSGYFPINTAVVTNGAGASYDTKPWVKVK